MAAILQLCPMSAYLEEGLARRGEVIRWFEQDAAAQAAVMATRAAQIRAVVTGGHLGCPNALIEALPSLGLIAVNGVGLDKVDLDRARVAGIRVSTTPGVLTDDVADLAIGLVIGLLRGIPAGDAFVRAGAWPDGEQPLRRRVSGCRFGIVGLGNIGGAIAARLAAFGPVAYTNMHDVDGPYTRVESVAALAAQSDVLVVACAATAETFHLIDGGVLEALGPQGYLVNVARGSVVDEAALAAALAAGGIAGAALDVFEREPHVPQALIESERTVLTPHVASATVAARTAMADLVLANVDALLAGTPFPSAVA